MSDDSEGLVGPGLRRAFNAGPGQLIGRGHTAGDLLEAWRWEPLERSAGYLRLRAAVPDAVRNPRGQLFGGFTPTYVDLVALLTYRSAQDPEARAGWLATLNMRVDYFEPIEDVVEIESRVVNQRGRNAWIETRFVEPGCVPPETGKLLAFALTTLRETDAPLPA